MRISYHRCMIGPLGSTRRIGSATICLIIVGTSAMSIDNRTQPRQDVVEKIHHVPPIRSRCEKNRYLHILNRRIRPIVGYLKNNHQ